jgi:hypothetical protein
MTTKTKPQLRTRAVKAAARAAEQFGHVQIDTGPATLEPQNKPDSHASESEAKPDTAAQALAALTLCVEVLASIDATLQRIEAHAHVSTRQLVALERGQALQLRIATREMEANGGGNG